MIEDSEHRITRVMDNRVRQWIEKHSREPLLDSDDWNEAELAEHMHLRRDNYRLAVRVRALHANISREAWYKLCDQIYDNGLTNEDLTINELEDLIDRVTGN